MTEDQKQAAVDMLMEAYFSRRMMSESESGGRRCIEEHKSSFEIQQDLSDMMSVSVDNISTYMILKGYKIVTEEDGSPKWQFYRILD